MMASKIFPCSKLLGDHGNEADDGCHCPDRAIRQMFDRCPAPVTMEDWETSQRDGQMTACTAR